MPINYALKLLQTFCFLLIAGLFTTASAYDLVVAKDGSGNYTTVQAAIDAVPTNLTSVYTIYIKNGRYKEKINIPSNKPFIQMIGESVANVILTYDDYSGKPMPGGGVFGTSNSASFTVRASDFSAINITFENTTGEAPQALAFYADGDRVALKNCRFLGGQDTVYAGGNGARQYYRNCYIDGTVDFIFGDARAIFDSCIIYAKTRSSAGQSYITAANTKAAETIGYIFRDCKVPANRGNTAYFFGRPWQNDNNTADAAKSHNKVIFLNTSTSSSIQTAGWSTWDGGTDVSKITFAEYKTKKFDGTLVDVTGRVAWSKQLSDTEAAFYYDNSNLFGDWDPCATAAGFCDNAQPDIAVSNFKGVKGSATSSFTWNISWPIDQLQFEILRSSDKINFDVVNTINASNDTTVNFDYSEAVPPPGNTFYYLVRASKAGSATHISDTVVISSMPTINTTGSLGSFLQGVGTPSTSQSYIVSAASLTNDLMITAPANYELSVDGGTTWKVSSDPVTLIPDANGNIANTTISVRLNGNAAGEFNDNISHTSVGATTVLVAVTGTIQSEPLAVSEIIQQWPMTVSNLDSADVRSPGVEPSAPTLNRLYISNGLEVPAVPPYSALHGQAFGATANGNGSWGTAVGGPGGNLNRTYYEQFVIKATETHSVRIDSLILSSSFYNTSSNTKLALVYSRTGFTTNDSTTNSIGGIGGDGTQMPASANGAFNTPVVLTNQTANTTVTYRFFLEGANGITLASGDSLTIRLYFSCGSSSPGRYAKVKNVYAKGLATANPLPLNLLSFEGVAKGGQVALQWQTTNEVNTKSFYIERSVDGVNYQPLETVPALNRSGVNKYNYVDVKPIGGTNYYRLKMMDKDGSSKYSRVAEVNVGRRGAVIIHSNPVTSALQVSHGAVKAGTVLKVVSTDGKLLLSKPLRNGSAQSTLNVSDLHAGIYLLVLQTNDGTTAQAFLKQ